MGKISFRKDIVQTGRIDDLYAIKVDLTTYNAAINDLQTSIATVTADYQAADEAVKVYAAGLVDALAAGAVQANTDAITILNGDTTVVGSVDKKIADAITGIINGAPEAYDTLQELLTYIDTNAADFTAFIDQTNAKIDAVVGAATVNWDTLEKVEASTLAIQADLQAQIDSLSATTTDLSNSIPIYKYDNELPISTTTNADTGAIEYRVTLTFVPYGDIMSNRAVAYTTDIDGNITIEGIYTIIKDTADATGKVYLIQSTDDISAMKASIEYFFIVNDQA